MKVGNDHIQSFKRSRLCTRVSFPCHLQKRRKVNLVRDPISVGIDPVRELSTVFCGVRNMIEVVVSNIVLVRNENWQKKDHYVNVFARNLQKSRTVKLAASVVGHPNNGEMVPPRSAE